MQLIQDVFVIEKLQVLNEGKNKGPMRIRGIFGRCNEKNNNGRIYPTKVLEGQIKKLEPLITERRLCGELDHPSNDSVKLSNASHLITKLEMKGSEVIGEAEILNTPAGLTAKALIEGGVRIGISSRGMGTLSEDDKGDKIVNEDFNLVTFDLVADPSTRGAFPSLTESTQTKFAKNKLSKLEKERNFVKLLESKLKNNYSEVEVIQERRAPKAKKIKKIKKEVFPEHSVYLTLGRLINEDFATEYEKELERMKAGRNIPPAPESKGFLGDIAARRHARKMEIARAKGRVKAAGIEQKGAILRARRNDRALQGKPTLKRDYAFLAAKKGLNLGRGMYNKAAQDIPDAASRIKKFGRNMVSKFKTSSKAPISSSRPNSPNVAQTGNPVNTSKVMPARNPGMVRKPISSLNTGPSRLSLNKGPDRPLLQTRKPNPQLSARPEQKRLEPAPNRPLLGPGPAKRMKKPGKLPPEISAGKRKGLTKKPITKNKISQVQSKKPGLGRTKKTK